MKSKQQFASFVLGAVSMLALGCFMGSVNSAAGPEQRYDAEIGSGGLQITDHASNTLYIYHEDRENQEIMKLVASADLTQAGKSEFSVTTPEKPKEK